MKIIKGVFVGWVLGAIVCASTDYIINPLKIFKKNKGLGWLAAMLELSLVVVTCERLSGVVNRSVIGYELGGFENIGFIGAIFYMCPFAWTALRSAYYTFHIGLFGHDDDDDDGDDTKHHLPGDHGLPVDDPPGTTEFYASGTMPQQRTQTKTCCADCK